VTAASDQSRRVVRQAQSSLESTTEYVLEEQPLAIAIVGLAAGAAVAAAFPPTDVERRVLGSTGERLREATDKVTERFKDAGTQAGERLVNAAEERGLTAEGLKEVARDVGSTFSATLSGDESTNAKSPSSQASRSGPKPSANSPSSQKRGQR
jgi:hypothetical protein